MQEIILMERRIAKNLVLLIPFTLCTALFTLIFVPNTVYATNDSENAGDIFYVAKFVCGSIEEGDDVLRPGHYDTSISIINKQINSTSFYWNVSVNDGPVSHSTLISLDSFYSTGLNCGDIKKVSGTEEKNLVEGFVLITIPQNYNPAKPYALTTSMNSSSNLEVQVFYTANALDTLPHEVIYEKIFFYILDDTTEKIPDEMIRTVLDITLKSDINQISNTEVKIKKILSETYDINDDELSQIKIRVKDISIGVGSMIDDHAISLSILKPQTHPGGAE